MSTEGDELGGRIRRVHVGDDRLLVELRDGRETTAPVASFPGLAHASEDERRRWRLLDIDRVIYWPDLDLRVSLDQLPPPQMSDWPRETE